MRRLQISQVSQLVLILILFLTPATLWANRSCSNSHNSRSFEELSFELNNGPKRRELSVDLQIFMADGVFPPEKMNEVRAWFAATKNLETRIQFQADQTLRIFVSGRVQRIESLLEALSGVFSPSKIQWRQLGPDQPTQSEQGVGPDQPTPSEQGAQPTAQPLIPPRSVSRQISGLDEQPDIVGFPGYDVPMARRVQPTAATRLERPSRIEPEATTAPLALDKPFPIHLKTSKSTLLIDVRELGSLLRRPEDLNDFKNFLETAMEWSIPQDSTHRVFEIAYQPLHSRSFVLLRFSVQTASQEQTAIFEKPQIFNEGAEKQYWADVAKYKEIHRESFPFASSMMIDGKLRAAVSISGAVLVRAAIKSRLAVKEIAAIIASVEQLMPDQSPGVYYQIVRYADRNYRIVIASDPTSQLKLISLFPLR